MESINNKNQDLMTIKCSDSCSHDTTIFKSLTPTNSQDTYSAFYALTTAIEAGDVNIISLQLAQNEDLIHQTDPEDGNTPLHIAALTGNKVIMELLIANGAKKEITNKANKTATNLLRCPVCREGIRYFFILGDEKRTMCIYCDECDLCWLDTIDKKWGYCTSVNYLDREERFKGRTTYTLWKDGHWPTQEEIIKAKLENMVGILAQTHSQNGV